MPERTTVDISALVTLGREKGFLTYEELNDNLPKEVTAAEEIDEIIRKLDGEEIEIIDAADAEVIQSALAARKRAKLRQKSEVWFVGNFDRVVVMNKSSHDEWEKKQGTVDFLEKLTKQTEERSSGQGSGGGRVS